MLHVFLVEDNEPLRCALEVGLHATGEVQVTGHAESGPQAIAGCLHAPPDAILMDVQLAGPMNGIEAAVAIRREHPRLPVVFYSIQDDDAFYRAFLHAGILSHYAYVRKSSYLLPQDILPLLRDAVAGRSYIEPEIEARVQQVRHRDENDPLDLLEQSEREVALLLARGLTNGQIARQLGFRDRRAVSRTNGQIYAAWGLNDSPIDEKVARTRAAIIVRERQLLVWDDAGNPHTMDARGKWVPWNGPAGKAGAR